MRLYFARGMDDLSTELISEPVTRLRNLLSTRGDDETVVVDPYSEVERSLREVTPPHALTRAIVEGDLALLRGCDVMLADMTIPGRSYVGCVAELVYAHQWRIPAIVAVGDSGLERRHWLRYHSTKCVDTLEAAVVELSILRTSLS